MLEKYFFGQNNRKSHAKKSLNLITVARVKVGHSDKTNKKKRQQKI